jgi:hypothetical protein
MGTKEVNEFQLSPNDLPAGIVHVSVLKSNGNLVASRDFYNPAEDNVQTKMQTNNATYMRREKVSVEVDMKDRDGNAIEGEISVKVLHEGLFDLKNDNSIVDEMALPFDAFKKYSVDRSTPNWLEALNTYLASVTENVPWSTIITNAIDRPRFTLSNFVQKSGKAFIAETHEPVPEESDIAFYLQNSKIRYQTKVEKGKVWLALPDLYGQDEMFYYGETFYYLSGLRHGQPISNLKIEWDDDFVELPHAPDWQETTALDPYASFANKRNMIDRSFGFYNSPKLTQPQKAVPGASAVNVADADVTIDVPSYTIFPTMAELIQEVIPGLQHRKKANGKDIIIVSLFESMSYDATGDPLYIIDGIVTKNTDFFLSLRPADLLEVKVVFDPKKLFPYHLLGKNGIVMVKTKDGEVREPLDDPSKIIEGLNKPVTFSTSAHTEVESGHTPDFRSTIYWNPIVKTDSNGKALIEFNCSDDVGIHSIQVDGRSKGGELFSAMGTIDVKRDVKNGR